MQAVEVAPTCFVPMGAGAALSVIIVNYNTSDLLERCIGSLRLASQGLTVQLVLVDNASRDGSAALIRQRFPDVHLLANAVNVGFGRANNQALAICDGRHVLLLNADAFVKPDTLSKALHYLDQHPECGVLGVRSVDESGQIMFDGRSFPGIWQNFTLQTGLGRWLGRGPSAALSAASSGEAVDCDWVVGCCYLVRREVLDKIGLFDPRYFLYFEEVDHCRAVHQAGWQVRCLVTSSVIHVGGASAESEGQLGAGRQISALQAESSLLYFRKHGGLPGLLAVTGLGLLAETILALKSVIRQQRWSGLATHARQAWLLCRLLVSTRGGTAPTR